MLKSTYSEPFINSIPYYLTYIEQFDTYLDKHVLRYIFSNSFPWNFKATKVYTVLFV